MVVLDQHGMFWMKGCKKRFISIFFSPLLFWQRWNDTVSKKGFIHLPITLTSTSQVFDLYKGIERSQAISSTTIPILRNSTVGTQRLSFLVKVGWLAMKIQHPFPLHTFRSSWTQITVELVPVTSRIVCVSLSCTWKDALFHKTNTLKETWHITPNWRTSTSIITQSAQIWNPWKLSSCQ